MSATKVNYRAMRAYDPRLVTEAVAAGLHDPEGDPLTEAERMEARALFSLAWRERRPADAAMDATLNAGHRPDCGCAMCL